MVFRNLIPDIIVLGRSFVFSQSCFQISASLPSISSLTVSTFGFVHSVLFILFYSILFRLSVCLSVSLSLPDHAKQITNTPEVEIFTTQ